MANKNTKTRKPMSSASKGVICLIVLIVLTVCASYLSVAGMNLDSEGVNVLLPWVPVSSGNWTKSLALDKALGGGIYSEYSYTLPGDASETALQDSANTIRARLLQMGESDAQVTVKDDVLRMEVRNMTSSHLASIRSMATAQGHFAVSDPNGNVILTEKDMVNASVNVNYNATRTSYSVVLTFKLNAEGVKKLADSGASYVSVTVDGDSVSSYATVTGDEINCTMGATNSAYNTAANVAFLKNYGAVDVNLVQKSTGTVNADQSIVLKVVLIVSAALLVCSLIYLVATGKLTGVSAFLSVWCAVVLSLFFVATIVVPSSVMLNTGCLVAILLGILVAMFTAVNRTDAISKQITAGSTPKQASKMGFSQAAKTVWIAHGAVLALALILMIFPFSKSTGYCLAAGVVGSAITTLVMRLYQGCFTMITNKPSLFGKVK